MMMKKYLQFPQTLYRIQGRLPVSLRDYSSQMARKRLSFDLKLNESGLVMPMPDGSKFHTPNGMSLRARSDKMMAILSNFQGDEVHVYRMQEGTTVPDGMCVYLEHSDHYSLQVTRPITLEQFNTQLTEYLQSLPALTKQEFIDAYNDIDDQDN